MSNPEMMAIGDSLYNGVRSLTINASLAQWSVPAQVARALNIPFAVPDYPRNVVVDMERWLRMFPDIAGVAEDVAANINFWLSKPKPASNAAAFDNLAIASTTYSDMYTRTWQTAETEIAQLKATYGSHLTDLGGAIGSLFFAFNTRFLLNPTGDENTPAQSSLAIVAERKPRRLLVSIGSNNGLWSMCFDATVGGFGAQDLSDMNDFMTQLAALPQAIQHIYINTLGLPSTVSNLMPIPDNAIDTKPGLGHFFANYENRFGFTYGTLTGDQVAALNATVSNVNDKLIAAAAQDPRIHVVRTDQLLLDYDAKHRADAQVVQVPYGSRSLTFTNVMTEAAPWPVEPSFRRGGLQGLDGMHPTVVGYALAAQRVLDAIQAHEGVAAAPLDMQVADRADTLLTDVPRSWFLVLPTWRDIRKAEHDGVALAQQIQHAQTRALMQAIDFKIR
jgi:lysophospholipase L1-like esterase